VVGLLDLPEVVGGPCGPAEPKTADLHDAPVRSSAASGSIGFLVTDRQADGGACGSARLAVRRTGGSFDEDLPAVESGYEIPAAIVYERSGQWFRIALERGSAWIERQNPSDFQAYPGLLMDRLDYLPAGWDGRLWDAAGTGAEIGVPSGWNKYFAGDIAVEVLGIRRLGNEAWIAVRLRTESCGNTLAGVQAVTGWLPAFRASGAPSVWFYSRGC
jgi:hypothetical protein